MCIRRNFKLSEMNNFSSELVISEEVIATIACNAARDVEGVEGLGDRPADVYTAFKINTNNLRHVKVTMSDYDIKLHIYVLLNSSARIGEVAENIQNSIKSAVQNMTGRVVTKVDVTINGIYSDIGEYAAAPVEPTE